MNLLNTNKQSPIYGNSSDKTGMIRHFRRVRLKPAGDETNTRAAKINWLRYCVWLPHKINCVIFIQYV